MNFWDIDTAERLNGLELKTFLNKKRIIKYLYRNNELSQAEISKTLHVSAPTSIMYLNELVENGYIENRGKGDSIGGRKPNMYGLKKDSVYVIGVDLGRKFLEIAIFNNDMEKVANSKLPSIPLDNKEQVINIIYDGTISLLKESNIEQEKIIGIGISMPGLINSEQGINYTYLYNDEELLADSFQQKFNRPVFLENDSKARALAEMRHGGAKDSNNALVIQIDWGLGLGMILNRKIYKGNSGFAGEFSHIPIDENGVLCNCGKVGCLETLASGNALVRLTLEGLKENKHSKLYETFIHKKENITPILIIDAAHNGDRFAISMINEVGKSLGKGISYLIQILNPEIVILDGILSKAKEYLITPIKQSLYNHCLPKVREDTQIILSPLGDDIGIIGSATVVLEYVLEDY